MHPEAVVRGTRLDLTAVEPGPLAHAQQAAPAARASCPLVLGPPPTSTTSTTTSSGPATTRARTVAAPACRRALVRASWRMRYAARSTPAGSWPASPSRVRSTARPAAASSPTSRSASRSRGLGARVGSGWSGAEAPASSPSAESSPRSSVRVERPTRWMARRHSAEAASAGSCASPASACTTISETLCATTSWTSRAMRSRCSAARARASAARPRRRSSDCSASRSTSWFRDHTTRPAIQKPDSRATMNAVSSNRFPVERQLVYATTGTSRSRDATAVRRGVWAADRVGADQQREEDADLPRWSR